ncbi:DUF1801 domain-containing protein [Maritalea sp.]|uniref:DUF1801 domain-containing protein n=1 Tax=Maritalea sp. TaxID=2003361 RepID=UPI003EF23AF1
MAEFEPNAIIAAIEELIVDLLPDATPRSMYGGTVLELVPGDHSTLIGGYFAHKAHVSLEFSLGVNFEDPKGLLEGKGKFRRHLKLRSLDDIAEKQVAYFIKQLKVD